MTLLASNYIRKQIVLGTLSLLSFLTSAYGQTTLSTPALEQKVDSVIQLMNLKEKIGQLVLYNGSWDVTGPPSDVGNQEKYDKLKNGEVGAMLNVTSVKETRAAQELVMKNSRLKIPLLFGYDVIHGYKTMFPIPLAESASWDMEAIQKGASHAAAEASASGINWTFAPMVDIARDARWGRIMEGAGEDPYLGARIAEARVKGFQGEDMSDPRTIASCAKHFAAYGFAEAGRDYNTVSISDSDLYNIVLPPFKAAAEAGAATFMSSFNDLNGIPATGNKKLQRDILKENWDWKGFVVSDWASTAEMIPHGYSKDLKQAAEQALNAGNDMDMEGRAFEKHLEELVSANAVNIADIDDAVKRVLRVKFLLGLFDDPYKYCDKKREKQESYSEENLVASEEMARKSVVLLKNEKNLLPIDKNIKTIAVIGPLANDKDSPLGSWRALAESNSAVSLLEGVKSKAPKNMKIIYEEGVALGEGERSFIREMKFNTTDKSGIPKAVEVAKKADLVILALGEEAFQSGEGRSQANIKLKGFQEELAHAVLDANPKTVVLLMNGRPLDITEINKKAFAVVEGWLLGSRAGNALADVLFGNYNPSGKLPVSFPRSVGQVPIYYNHKNTGRPSNDQEMVFWSHYTDEENAPLYPFGHGLSYTTFDYSNFSLSAEKMSASGSILAKVTVKNTGKYKGKEVVQLYTRDHFGSYVRPVKELKGFELIELEPGQSKEVTFTIDTKMLQFYTPNNKWEAEPGTFTAFVGGSSDTKFQKDFELTN